MPEKLKSRFLDELTARQAQTVMKRTGMVILPVGTLELHGPHMPLGCDGFITQALAFKIAEKADCLVAPLEPFSFIGGTSRFKGGVSVPFSASMEFLKHIVRALIAGGFRKIVLMSAHMPNATALTAVAREMFEETGLPILNLRPFSLIDDEMIADVLGSAEDALMEATLLAGSLKVLGKDYLIEPGKWKHVDTVPLTPESARRLMRVANVGFYYTSEMSHQPPRAGVDPDKGVILLERGADRAKNIGKDMDDYIKWLDKTFGKDRAGKGAPYYLA